MRIYYTIGVVNDLVSWFYDNNNIGGYNLFNNFNGLNEHIQKYLKKIKKYLTLSKNLCIFIYVK